MIFTPPIRTLNGIAEAAEKGILLTDTVEDKYDKSKVLYQRLTAQRDAVLSKGMCVIHIPSPGGPQETICLPLKYLNGWLFKISTRRVKNPEARAKLIRYQEECYEVLYEHFNPTAKPADTTPVADKQPDGIGHVKDRRYGKLITVSWYGQIAVFNRTALVLAGKAMLAGKMVQFGEYELPYVGGYLAQDAIVKAMEEVLGCA